MKRTFQTLLWVFILLLPYCITQAQESTNVIPRIGQKIPEFSLKNVGNFTTKEISDSDMKGKWHVLYFWDKYCGACMESFSHEQSLQNHFSKSIQFILVAKQDPDTTIRRLYQQFADRLNLTLPIAFDSSVFHKFNIDQVAYIITVDPYGIIRAITKEISEEDLNMLLAGKQALSPRAYTLGEERTEMKFDPGRPFLIHGNGGDDTSYLYRSVLSKWAPNMQITYPGNNLRRYLTSHSCQVLGQTFFSLVRLAYFGIESWTFGDSLYNIAYPKFIWKVSQKSSEKIDDYRYCYSLDFPPNSISIPSITRIMQRDLEHYFGYTIRVHKVKVPCYTLHSSKRARKHLKSLGSKPETQGDKLGPFSFKNMPFEYLIRRIYSTSVFDFPIFNKTNIKGNVDITMNCILSDSTDIIKGLKENGLYIKRTHRKMDAIIVTDF